MLLCDDCKELIRDLRDYCASFAEQESRTTELERCGKVAIDIGDRTTGDNVG